MHADELAKVLDELSRRFGPVATQLYELAVRQAAIEGALGLVLGLLAVVVSWLIWIYSARWYWRTATEKAKTDRYSSGPDIFTVVLAGLAPVMVTVFAALPVYNGILWLLNPQWAAIQVLSRLLP